MRARAERGSRARRSATSALLALATSLGAALAPGTAKADDSQQFELVKGLFYAGQYEDLVKRMAILLDTSNPACGSVEGAPTAPQTCHLADTVLIERSREMLVVALVALKKQPEADAVIEKMLRQNMAYTPEPGSLPAAVVERFREIKARLQKEIEDKARKDADDQRRAALQNQSMSEAERKWLAEMTKLASTETIIEKRSRFLAFVPFGVGQIQNGDTALGLVFAGSQALAAGTAITLATSHAFLTTEYASLKRGEKDSTGQRVDTKTLYDQIVAVSIGNQIAFSAFAALAIAGIVEANVAFVPEVRTTRERKVPKRPAPQVVPTVGVSSTGVNVGFVGVF